jgi:RimJ/RimL family protein N-acetyltransferase
LRGDRIELRPLDLAAAESLRDGGDGGLTWIADGPFEGTREAAGGVMKAAEAGRYDPAWGIFAIVRPDDGLAIGGVGFHGPPVDGLVEIGFDLVPAARGQGYAAESVRVLSRWALARDEVTTVVGRTEPDNVASQRVMESAGFVRVPGPEGEMLSYHLDG